jgi:hypothetical protein
MKYVAAKKRRGRSMQGNGGPVEVYRTKFGRAILTKAEDYLPSMPANSVDLVVTSPPFALLRQKAYGNLDQADYVDWLVSFGPLVRRVLKDTGSLVVCPFRVYRLGATGSLSASAGTRADKPPVAPVKSNWTDH